MKNRIVIVPLILIMLMQLFLPVSAAQGCEEKSSPLSAVELLSESVQEPVRIRKELSAGVQNIVKRARQMTYISWTPLKDITGWEEFIIYRAGETYSGLPYGQPIYADYVPWETNLDGFAAAVKDPKSKMYTDKSTYNETAPYYSTDCSAYVSWAWNLSSRKTTVSIPGEATLISKTAITNAQVGDAICKKGEHVVLITDITYDENGAINFVEISEATAKEGMDCCCLITCYGDGYALSLADLQAKYFDNGYYLYRSLTRDSVRYTHSCAVALEGDNCKKCKAGQYASEGELYGSVLVTSEKAFSYAMPIKSSEIKEAYVCDSRISVTEKGRDGFGKLWYKTDKGYWLSSEDVKFYENEVCTQWSEQYPQNVDENYIEQAVFYRSAELETVMSDVPELEGHTLKSKKWVKYNTESLLGITEWPDNFDRNSAFFSKYDLTYLTSVREETYARTVSRPASYGYTYYHYCENISSSSPDKKAVSSVSTSKYKKFHSFYSKVSPETLKKVGNCYIIANSVCKCSNRYYAIKMEIRKYNEFYREYTYTCWGDWSEWTQKPITPSNSLKVDSETFYRYNDTGHKWMFTLKKSDSTCSSAGESLYTCADCGAVKVSYEPLKEHTESKDYRVKIPADFKKDGVEATYCTVCGEDITVREIPKIGKVVQSFTSTVYGGEAQSPYIWFYDSEGKKLTYKTDYTAKYPSGRKKPGEYTVTITFKGRYDCKKDITYTIKPSVVNLELIPSKNSVTLRWNDLEEATGYRVYRYDAVNKKYKALKTTWSTEYTDSDLKSGKNFVYVVKAYTKSSGEYYWGGWAKLKTTTLKG